MHILMRRRVPACRAVASIPPYAQNAHSHTTCAKHTHFYLTKNDRKSFISCTSHRCCRWQNGRRTRERWRRAHANTIYTTFEICKTNQKLRTQAQSKMTLGWCGHDVAPMHTSRRACQSQYRKWVLADEKKRRAAHRTQSRAARTYFKKIKIYTRLGISICSHLIYALHCIPLLAWNLSAGLLYNIVCVCVCVCCRNGAKCVLGRRPANIFMACDNNKIYSKPWTFNRRMGGHA